MSYSLTYHLVESGFDVYSSSDSRLLTSNASTVALKNTGGMELDGLDYNDMVHRFQHASGRCTGLGEKEQVSVPVFSNPCGIVC